MKDFHWCRVDTYYAVAALAVVAQTIVVLWVL